MDIKDIEHSGFAGKLAGIFIDSKLTPLTIIGSLLLGILAIIMLGIYLLFSLMPKMLSGTDSSEVPATQGVSEAAKVVSEQAIFENNDKQLTE